MTWLLRSMESMRRVPSVEIPQEGKSGLRLLRRVGTVDPTSLDAYRVSGGYSALSKAIDMGSTAIIDEIKASNLRGRGGAAFPMGIKWDGVANSSVETRYLICNADESEPGTFKDRVLMEGDPFGLVESMTITAIATGVTKGYIYIRAEYPVGRARLEHAIAQAHGAGCWATMWPAAARRSISRFDPAPVPTSAVKKPRSWSRSRGTGGSRATSHRSQQSRDCSANQRSSTTSRRS